jgi:hypothetical protein
MLWLVSWWPVGLPIGVAEGLGAFWWRVGYWVVGGGDLELFGCQCRLLMCVA